MILTFKKLLLLPYQGASYLALFLKYLAQFLYFKVKNTAY
jgi:hypothetical protein